MAREPEQILLDLTGGIWPEEIHKLVAIEARNVAARDSCELVTEDHAKAAKKRLIQLLDQCSTKPWRDEGIQVPLYPQYRVVFHPHGAASWKLHGEWSSFGTSSIANKLHTSEDALNAWLDSVAPPEWVEKRRAAEAKKRERWEKLEELEEEQRGGSYVSERVMFDLAHGRV